MISASLVKELREKSGAGMMECKKALTEVNGDIDKAMDYLRENGLAKVAKKASRIAAEGLANVFIDNNKAVILEVNAETDFVSKNQEFIDLIANIGKAILKSDAKNFEEAKEVKADNGTVNDLIVEATAKIGEKISFRRCEIVTKEDNETFGSYLHMGGKIAVLVKLEGANEEVAKDVAMQSAAMKPQYVFTTDVPEDVLEHEREVQKTNAMNEGKPEEIAVKMVEGRIKKFYKEVCLEKQEFIKDSSLDIDTYIKNNNGKLLSMIRYEVGEGMEKRNDDFASEVMNQINGK